jgi:hypothetical protein
MSNLLTRHRLAVHTRGELVVVELGNYHFSLEFALALQLAAVMRHEARLIAKGLGVRFRESAVGVLHDASAPKPKRKRFIEKLPGMLRCRGLEVYGEGHIVMLKAGGVTAGLPFEVAHQFSQWLRLHGKEAKRNAGEHSHWSKIAKPEAIAAGARPF